MEGEENAVPFENLIVNKSETIYLKEIFGSNEDSFFIDSYLAASLISKFS